MMIAVPIEPDPATIEYSESPFHITGIIATMLLAKLGLSFTRSSRGYEVVPAGHSGPPAHRQHDRVGARFSIHRYFLIFGRILEFLRGGAIREFHDHDLVARSFAFQHHRMCVRHQQLALKFAEYAHEARLVAVVEFAAGE